MGNLRAQASKNSVTAKQEVKPSLSNVRRPLSGLPENHLSKNVADSHDKPVAGSHGSGSFDYGSISIFPNSKTPVRLNSQALPIQAKLTIGQPNDKYEQEADRVAEQVMRMPEQTVQRKCAKCDKEEEMIQTKSKGNSGSVASSALMNQIQKTRGGGQVMDTNTRSFMEPRFGMDFSGVRIHADNQAAGMSQGINAKAFTVGNDIYFNEGKYDPNSTSGKHLLAHELTHTAQQGRGASQKLIKKERTSSTENRVNMLKRLILQHK